ncbi:MAG TPA: hypothetical protein ENK25_09265 [Bacteroidetes bacterium]|nr:hypothetical protein [Bacteroidota bacterium]
MKFLRFSIACLFLLTVLPGQMNAQKPSRVEQLNAQRVAFITEKLQLTPAEAQIFWPVYNEYRRKKNELEQKKIKLLRDYGANKETLSDKEIEKIADQYVQIEKEETDLLLQYHEKIKKVLPVKKVMMLYRVERQFQAFLLQQLRSQRGRNNRQLNR